LFGEFVGAVRDATRSDAFANGVSAFGGLVQGGWDFVSSVYHSAASTAQGWIDTAGGYYFGQDNWQNFKGRVKKLWENPWVQAAVTVLLIVCPELDPLAMALKGLSKLLTIGEDVNLALRLAKAEQAIGYIEDINKYYNVPEGWIQSATRSGKGFYLHPPHVNPRVPPGALGSGPSVRIMDGDLLNPQGYKVYYGPRGNRIGELRTNHRFPIDSSHPPGWPFW
jgi:hypothetical protein